MGLFADYDDTCYTLKLEICGENLDEVRSLYEKIQKWTKDSGKLGNHTYANTWFGNIVKGAQLGRITMVPENEYENTYFCDGFINDMVISERNKCIILITDSYDKLSLKIWNDLAHIYLTNSRVLYEAEGWDTGHFFTNKKEYGQMYTYHNISTGEIETGIDEDLLTEALNVRMPEGKKIKNHGELEKTLREMKKDNKGIKVYKYEYMPLVNWY